jgi:hypothetical protein
MSKALSDGVGVSVLVNFRISRAEHIFYKKQAGRAGLTLSDYLRNLILQGAFAEKASEFTERFEALASKLSDFQKSLDGSSFPETTHLAILTMHEVMKNTVIKRDPEEWKTALASAQNQLSKL